jgi:hypothetical protein
MRKIAVLYGGSYQHHFMFKQSKFAPYFDALIPLRKFADTTLDEFDVLIIPSWSHMNILEQNADKIRAFADTGKIVVTLGPQHFDWLPNCKWEDRQTNFWWWLEPGADSGLRLVGADHPLFKNYLTLDDATWHQHGVYRPSEGCEILVSQTDGAAVLYVDKVNTNGIWINTTLDPDFHVGMHFMPAAERFLTGFLPWLREGEI